MKLAILGTGKIVDEVLPILAERSGLELVAILSTPRSLAKAQELAQTYGMALATSDYQDILTSPAVDTVYIATPNHTHYAYAKQALLAGKHVICEKPFTMTLSELEDLVAIAEQHKLFLLEAITNQYLPNFAILKKQLANIGDVKIVECNYSQYSSRYDAFKAGDIAPAFNPEMGGGALRDLNIYNIHLLVGLFGQPQSVSYLANMERGVDTSGILLLDYGRFKAVAIGAKDCTAEIKSTIQGDKGSLAVFGATNTLPQISLQLNGQEAETFDENKDKHRMVDEFDAFVTIIEEKDTARAKQALEHSLAVMRVLEQAVSSMTADNR